MSLVVRGGEPALVKSEIWAIDSSLPAYDVLPMGAILRASVATERFSAAVVAALSAIALGIASLGVYGVIAFFVSQRSREIALRLALGATRRDILAVVMGRGIGMTLSGVVIGLAGVSLTTRYLSSLLFGVSPFDPPTLAGVCAVLTAVALLACYLPARRASRIDPVSALRSD